MNVRSLWCKVILLMALVAAGCSAAATPVPLPTLTGTFTLKSSDVMPGPNGTCHGTGGYSDVVPPMPVTVKDQGGTIIATGAANFDASKPTSTTTTAGFIAHSCNLIFEIPSLPDATFYSIEVGHRGALTYSRADLAAAGWHVDFTLGG